MTTAIDLSDYDVPGRGRGILDVFRWRYLLRLLVRKGTATRYRNSVLGWTWSYVKPAAMFVVYYFVMGFIFQGQTRTENFAIFLFAGVVVINLFNEGFGNSTTSILANGSLVKKIYLPRELFPIAAIIVAFVHFLPQLAILLIICILWGWVPTVLGVLAVLGGVSIVTFFALGLGLFFSGLNVRFRDAENFVEIIKMFSTWTSPVLYPWQLVANELPEWLFRIYMANPLTVAVELFHYGMWGPTTSTGETFPPGFGMSALIAVIITLVTLVAGQFVFRHFERSFAQDL